MNKNKQDKGMNNKVRLTEKQLHSVIKESVHKLLNEISCGGTSKQGNPYDNWGGGFGDNWSDEQWSEYEKKRAEKYKDMPNRDYFNEGRDYTWEYDYVDKDGKGVGFMKHQEPKKRPRKTNYKDGDTLPNGYIKKGDYAINPRLAESQLHNIVKESINKVLQEGWFGNLFNRGNNEQPSKEQGIKATDLPAGVYPSLKGATMGISSQKYVIVYELRTNWKTLYVHPYTVERLGINAVISKLRKLGIKVLSNNQERFENPNWNGLNYDRKVEPKYGYGDGERDDFTTLSWPSRM